MMDGFHYRFMLFTHQDRMTHQSMKIKRMSTILLGLLICYLLLCGVAWFYQSKLIFPGSQQLTAHYQNFASREFILEQDDVTLQGWHLENLDAANSHVLFYFGGNAEDVAGMLPVLSRLPVRHVYTFNYRGYGLSDGLPSQTGFYADALAIYDRAASLHSGENVRFFVMGRSLGSAVTGYLATQKPMHGVVLLAPLKSALQNGQRTLPFVPVKWLMKHPFDLQGIASQITAPTLMLIANDDVVIPVADSLETWESLGGDKELVRLEKVGHNNLFDNPATFKAIERFLQQKATD